MVEHADGVAFSRSGVVFFNTGNPGPNGAASGEEVMRKPCLFQSTIAGVGLGLLVTMALIPIARGEEPQLSISGYDPVAYFTDGKPIKGNAEFEYLWHKLRWRFASSGHRDLFVSSPSQYAPQYDGYCAMGVTTAKTPTRTRLIPRLGPSSMGSSI